MELGTKVLTNHGQGVVVGWEAFNLAGESVAFSPVANGNRIVIKLDVALWYLNGFYYTREAELKVL